MLFSPNKEYWTIHQYMLNADGSSTSITPAEYHLVTRFEYEDI